jgi:Domain of unknown function (DUF4349)
MSDTIATPTSATPNAENATSPVSSPTFGQSIWHELLATARRISSKRGPITPTHARAFLSRNWLLTACCCALALLLAKAVTRPAALQHLGTMTEDKGAASRAVQVPLSTPIANTVSGFQANKEYTRTSASADSDEGEESPVDPAPGFEPSAPMIARTVSLSLVAKDFSSSRAALESILARHHGYAASLTASTQPNTARSLQASLRIPAPELNAAIAELKSLGRIENENQTGEEVTQQHADLFARLKNSRETEQRLQAILLQRTGKISDVLAVEQEIARVRREIEQMEAEQKGLEHRVAFASIDLSLAEEYKAQIGSPSPAASTRIHNALVRGYKDAIEDLLGIVLLFAEYGLTLLIWLAFLLPVAWFVRRRWLRANALVAPSAGA